jgi:hypothetical protein
MGLDPQAYTKLVSGISTGASQYAHLAQQGNSNIKPEEYQKMAKAMKMGNLSGADAKSRIMGLKSEDVKNLTLALSKDPETFLSMLGPDSSLGKALEENAKATDKAAQKKKSEEVAVSQRPTAEIFADAFSNLFNSISKPLVSIMDMIEGWFGDGDKAETGAVKKLSDALSGDGGDMNKLQGGSSSLLKYANQLQDAIDNETDDKKKASMVELQKKLTDAANAMTMEVSKHADYAQRAATGDMTDKDFNAAYKEHGASQQMAQGLAGLLTMGKDGTMSLTGDAAKQFNAMVNPTNPMEGPNASKVKPSAATPAADATTTPPAKSGDTYNIKGVVYKGAPKPGDRVSTEQANSDPDGTSDVVQGSN